MKGKVIVIGANSKATENQCKAAFTIGQTLVDNDYLCIHGGGCGTMLHTTLGMKYKNKVIGDSLTYIIWPVSMKLENTETCAHYDHVYKKIVVPTIHDRIGVLIEESKDCDFIICYGGGMGTIHELFSILVNYYDKTHLMPRILFCSVDASTLLNQLNLMMAGWDIPQRPYMSELIQKLDICTVEEICDLLKYHISRKNS